MLRCRHSLGRGRQIFPAAGCGLRAAGCGLQAADADGSGFRSGSQSRRRVNAADTPRPRPPRQRPSKPGKPDRQDTPLSLLRQRCVRHASWPSPKMLHPADADLQPIDRLGRRVSRELGGPLRATRCIARLSCPRSRIRQPLIRSLGAPRGKCAHGELWWQRIPHRRQLRSVP